MTGVHAGEVINVDDARYVGEQVMADMEGQCVLSDPFKRRQQAVTLASKSNIKIGEEELQVEELQVDPQLLFQRLIIVSTSLHCNKEHAFAYELCSYPPALFDKTLMMREPQKSVLEEALWSKVPALSSTTGPTGDVQLVLDGGLYYIEFPGPVVFHHTENCVYCTATDRKSVV